MNSIITIAPEILDFIHTAQWRFAKTMPQCPHEYVVREWWPDQEQVFERLVMLIREHGYDAQFAGRTYRYLDIDGWQYWTMGAPLEETTIINRCKKEKR